MYLCVFVSVLAMFCGFHNLMLIAVADGFELEITFKWNVRRSNNQVLLNKLFTLALPLLFVPFCLFRASIHSPTPYAILFVRFFLFLTFPLSLALLLAKDVAVSSHWHAHGIIQICVNLCAQIKRKYARANKKNVLLYRICLFHERIIGKSSSKVMCMHRLQSRMDTWNGAPSPAREMVKCNSKYLYIVYILNTNNTKLIAKWN